MSKTFTVVGLLILLSAAARRVEAAEPRGENDARVGTLEETEPIAQAREDLTKLQTACTYGCAIAAGAGCAAVSGTCAAGTVWTIGGATSPCIYAVIAACGAYNAIGVSCALQCSR